MPLASARFQRNARLQRASDGPPSIKVGEKGEAVEILQQALIDLGFPMPKSQQGASGTDGIFGAETQAAVKAFQANHTLSSDGSVGPQTLQRLDSILVAREAAGRARTFVDAQLAPRVGKWQIS